MIATGPKGLKKAEAFDADENVVEEQHQLLLLFTANAGSHWFVALQSNAFHRRVVQLLAKDFTAVLCEEQAERGR